MNEVIIICKWWLRLCLWCNKLLYLLIMTLTLRQKLLCSLLCIKIRLLIIIFVFIDLCFNINLLFLRWWIKWLFQWLWWLRLVASNLAHHSFVLRLSDNKFALLLTLIRLIWVQERVHLLMWLKISRLVISKCFRGS